MEESITILIENVKNTSRSDNDWVYLAAYFVCRWHCYSKSVTILIVLNRDGRSHGRQNEWNDGWVVQACQETKWSRPWRVRSHLHVSIDQYNAQEYFEYTELIPSHCIGPHICLHILVLTEVLAGRRSHVALSSSSSSYFICQKKQAGYQKSRMEQSLSIRILILSSTQYPDEAPSAEGKSENC